MITSQVITLYKTWCFMRMKHIEVDCHVVWIKYDIYIIEPKFVSSVSQLVYLLTEPLGRSQVQF